MGWINLKSQSTSGAQVGLADIANEPASYLAPPSSHLCFSQFSPMSVNPWPLNNSKYTNICLSINTLEAYPMADTAYKYALASVSLNDRKVLVMFHSL